MVLLYKVKYVIHGAQWVNILEIILILQWCQARARTGDDLRVFVLLHTSSGQSAFLWLSYRTWKRGRVLRFFIS